MNKTTSIYLDLTRFLASAAVLLGHASYARFNGEWMQGIGFLKHDAVIVFFVLSGYVIAYVSKHKENDIVDYSISRFARLYSVVLPALLITIALDHWGAMLDPQRYSGYAYDYPLIRVFSHLLFISQLHFVSISAFSNGPFWSISFEFWYYVIFAVLFYLKGYKKLISIGVCLLVGIKILLLFPIWMLGVCVFYVGSMKIAKSMGWLLFLGSFVLYYLFHYNSLDHLINAVVADALGDKFVEKLLWAGSFLSDYILAILVGFNFIGFVAISESVSGIFAYCQKPIRFLAGYTFSMYLLHFPLLNFFATIVDSNLVIVLLTVVCIFVVGTMTENK